MGNRLSKIYTRTGDNGTSALANGQRLNKNELVFEVMGDVDELNSHIGMVHSLHQQIQQSQTITTDIEQQSTSQDVKKLTDSIANTLNIIQHLLFNLGGELAMQNDDYRGIHEHHIQWLEEQMDEMNSHLSPLKDFILQKGTPLMCQLHISRSVCRRAERHAIALQSASKKAVETPKISQTSIQFLNRLSDWLFVTVRFVGLSLTEEQRQEILWNKEILV